MTRLAVAAGLMLVVTGWTEAHAWSYLPCSKRVVEVPAHPRLVVEGRDASRVQVRSREYGEDARPVARTVTVLDGSHLQVTLDLEIGEAPFVSGFLGPRCSGRTMKVVANWHADRTAPPAPEVAVYGSDRVQITWEEERKNDTWWMRLEWAANETDFARGRYQTAYASWIEWLDLAPGASLELRMIRLLPDGSESAPWHGTITRALDGDTRVMTRSSVVGNASVAMPARIASVAQPDDRSGNLLVLAALAALACTLAACERLPWFSCSSAVLEAPRPRRPRRR